MRKKYIDRTKENQNLQNELLSIKLSFAEMKKYYDDEMKSKLSEVKASINVVSGFKEFQK